jgi:hypothetical protein
MARTSRRQLSAILLTFVGAPLLLGATSLGSDFERRLLASHNEERSALGLDSLRWSDQLARGAAEWANHLAITGKFEHSPNPKGQRIGENIWAGTSGRFSPERMVGRWLAEKRYFKAGIFPESSTSGVSSDVSHYTQVIWSRTTDIGCAVAQGTGEEILVCRYSTAGNVWGQSPL